MAGGAIPERLRALAESPDAYMPQPPGFERIATDRYSLLLGPTPHFTSVQRVCCGAGDVAGTVDEVRRLVLAHGHAEAIWWIGESSAPADLYERLLREGLRPPARRFKELLALASATPPPEGPPDVEARPVESYEELLEAVRIRWEAFDAPQAKREEELAHLRDRFRLDRESGITITFVALVDGKPAGSATGVFGEHGCLLVGGATAEWARGRGAYRALVRARWNETVRRGAPGLAVQAAPASEPILRRLGFDHVCTLRRLEDPETR